MNVSKMIRFSCVLVAILAALVIRTEGATATQTHKCGKWHSVPSPNPFGSIYLFGVTALSTNDVWAVGDGQDNTLTLTEHWDGAKWSVITSPNEPGAQWNTLYAVSGASPNDIWAVGTYENNGLPYNTLIEHWDGSQWSIVPSPNLSQSYNSLYSVAAISANDAWAVGDSYSPDHVLIEHWNGTKWSVVSSPQLGTSMFLAGITAVSANNIWAVGNVYRNTINGTINQTLIEHWNGDRWSVVSSPNDGTLINSLKAVAASSDNDIWAVGYIELTTAKGPVNRPEVEHWDGVKWSLISSPLASSSYGLLSVVAISPNDAWDIGFQQEGGMLIEHWDGNSWRIVPSPQPYYGELMSIAATSAHHVWAVGTQTGKAGKTLIEYYC